MPDPAAERLHDPPHHQSAHRAHPHGGRRLPAGQRRHSPRGHQAGDLPDRRQGRHHGGRLQALQQLPGEGHPGRQRQRLHLCHPGQRRTQQQIPVLWPGGRGQQLSQGNRKCSHQRKRHTDLDDARLQRSREAGLHQRGHGPGADALSGDCSLRAPAQPGGQHHHRSRTDRRHLEQPVGEVCAQRRRDLHLPRGQLGLLGRERRLQRRKDRHTGEGCFQRKQ